MSEPREQLWRDVEQTVSELRKRGRDGIVIVGRSPLDNLRIADLLDGAKNAYAALQKQLARTQRKLARARAEDDWFLALNERDYKIEWIETRSEWVATLDGKEVGAGQNRADVNNKVIDAAVRRALQRATAAPAKPASPVKPES